MLTLTEEEYKEIKERIAANRRIAREKNGIIDPPIKKDKKESNQPNNRTEKKKAPKYRNVHTYVYEDGHM